MADKHPPPEERRRRRPRRGRAIKAETNVESGQHREIAENLVALSDISIREVMTPRIDVETLTTPVNAGDVARAVRESGHSCYPVVLDDLDDVVGLLFVKDLFRAGRGGMLDEGGQLSAVDISRRVRQPLMLPESMDVLEALSEMRAEQRSVALVVDEYGGVAGILSLKDLLQPLVGDLTDELATRDEPEVVRVDANRWLIDGQITLDDLAEAIGLALPEGEYVTLAGWLLDQLGEIPDEGETLEFEGWTFRVHDMEKRRIAEVLVRRPDDNRETTSSS
ncbi:MAG: transporter associated domain-containing protein [Actinomycetes bacterium]